MDQGGIAYPPFTKVSVATMTMVTHFEGFEVRSEVAYQLLPVTRLEGVVLKKRKKDSRPLGPPGTITSLRYKDQCRGLCHPTKENNFFKNCTTLDLSTEIKDVSIKISREKLHMCGAKSEANARQGYDLIMSHLRRLDEDLRYIQCHLYEGEKARRWFLDEVCGEEVTRYRSVPLGKSGQNLLLPNKDCSIVKKDIIVPDDIDSRITALFIPLVADFAYHSDLVHVTAWILTLDSLFETPAIQGKSSPLPLGTPLNYGTIYRAMANYNFNLGGAVNRWDLSQRINWPFEASYDNTVNYTVTVRLPFSLEEVSQCIPGEWVERRNKQKSKGFCHTFTICQSGSVMLSSPNESLAEKAYHEFMREVLNLGVIKAS